MNELVLITGISGFIAKRIALNLLQSGYHVRGTLRTPARAEEISQTMQEHGADTSRLSFVEADLDADAGWVEAADGCDYVQHVASPFPIDQPRDREALVPQARQGALRVLDAALAANVKKVILTSSMVAMMYRANRAQQVQVHENDWTDPEWDQLSAYIVSKTRAEMAAWEWARESGWEQRLTVVNPGFVLGPALDGQTGTSLNVIELIMRGAFPAIPPVSFPIVDVRDLAALHVKAMQSTDTGGRRLIGAADTLSMTEMGNILRDALPDHAKRIPTRTFPAFVVRLLANFNASLKTITPDLGVTPIADNAYVTDLTTIEFRPAADAVRAAGQSLVDHNVIRISA